MVFPLRSFATTGLLLLVSACGTGNILTGSPINDDGRIHPSAFHVAGSGQFPTVIRGNPSNLGDDAFQDAVLSVLHLPGGFPATTFTLNPDPPVSHTFRLVLVFAPENRAVSAITICSGEAEVPVSRVRDEVLFLKAAYCNRGDPLSETFGQTTIMDYRSEKFRTMMFLVMYQLFPPHRTDPGNCFRLPPC